MLLFSLPIEDDQDVVELLNRLDKWSMDEEIAWEIEEGTYSLDEKRVEKEEDRFGVACFFLESDAPRVREWIAG